MDSKTINDFVGHVNTNKINDSTVFVNIRKRILHVEPCYGIFNENILNENILNKLLSQLKISRSSVDLSTTVGYKFGGFKPKYSDAQHVYICEFTGEIRKKPYTLAVYQQRRSVYLNNLPVEINLKGLTIQKTKRIITINSPTPCYVCYGKTMGLNQNGEFDINSCIEWDVKEKDSRIKKSIYTHLVTHDSSFINNHNVGDSGLVIGDILYTGWNELNKCYIEYSNSLVENNLCVVKILGKVK